ncbi:helix-turn-helix domain-containing protein [Tropicibacter sp. R15_0]|uniref:helix-turn-helix domain-containing protein n=1 Tax=Tropicibacter sp. R15_0 TaxID=2821101 RepID=UPI001ADA1D0E|nr:helix-turn-helix domain-containing protein [Tropicibacter sp. R15_0]MBO9467036.1 helix-turn-helix domain-containing protein [Tropicibacter sp. R15_0]
MANQLIAVDAGALDALVAEVKALRQEVQAARITPENEWITIPKAAQRLEVSESTIRRRIGSGEIEAKGSGKMRLVRL